MTIDSLPPAMSNAAIRAAFHDLDQAAWLRTLIESQQHASIDGVDLPRFPPLAYQTATHGSCGSTALKEASRFVRYVFDYAAREMRPVTATTTVLDFGCGWGRMLRFFLKDVDAANLYGVDVRQDTVELAQRLNPYARFMTVAPLPPSPFGDQMFDIVCAYSVFSHINEAASRAWIGDFARTLKPGGLAFVTTQGRWFLDFVGSLSNRRAWWSIRSKVGRWLGRPQNEAWLDRLRRGFGDIRAAKQRWSAGDFVHAPTGGGEGLADSFYGETVIPRSYVEREWTGRLQLVDFIDNRRRLPQALIVLRKSPN